MGRRSAVLRTVAGYAAAMCLCVTGCTGTGNSDSPGSPSPASGAPSTVRAGGESTTVAGSPRSSTVDTRANTTPPAAASQQSPRSRADRTDDTATNDSANPGTVPPGTNEVTTSQRPSTSAHIDPVKAAIRKIMSTSIGGRAIATARGTLAGPSKTVRVIAQVLAIHRGHDSTVLIWLLKSASGKEVRTSSFQLAHPPLLDTRLVSLVDRRAGRSYYPYTYVPYQQPGGQDTGCLCSDVPASTDGHGTVLYAVMPALPTGTTSVDVTIPGFTTMKAVPVTR